MYNAEVESRMRKVENAAKKHGVALGTISSNWEHACERFAQGYQMVTLGADSVWVLQGANQAVANFKKKFGE
jgi:2-keto-3-deoxy-L-rhamnonate aldolase RhmA